MNNITKNRQDKEQIIKMVERVFGENISLKDYHELSEGFCNVAYWLKLSDDRECILKISPDQAVKLMSCEVEMMQTEVKAMKLARVNHIPGVARVYGYDKSREISSGEYFIMEKLPGKSFSSIRGDMTEEEQEEVEFKIGQCLSQLQHIKGKKFGHFCEESLQYEDWYTAFSSMLKRIIEDGIAVNMQIAVPYKEVLQKLKKHKPYFEEVTEPHLVHWDSWDGNFFVKNGEITAMIDWERALWAEGLMEDRFRFHNKSRSFRTGYGIEQLTKSQLVRSRWYDVYLYLIMMFEGTYRHYDNNDQYNWVSTLFSAVWPEIKKF